MADPFQVMREEARLYGAHVDRAEIRHSRETWRDFDVLFTDGFAQFHLCEQLPNDLTNSWEKFSAYLRPFFRRTFGPINRKKKDL